MFNCIIPYYMSMSIEKLKIKSSLFKLQTKRIVFQRVEKAFWRVSGALSTVLYFSILFSYNAVFADILAIVFTRFTLTLTNKKLAIFVLVKLEVAHICIGFLIINIIPTSITQISH